MPEWDLGRRVIGDAKFEAYQRQMAETADGALGERVVGPLVDDQPVPAPAAPGQHQVPPAPEQPEAYSVATIRTLLKESPHRVEEILNLELARPDVRRGALRALREAEARREGGPREDVLERISTALTTLFGEDAAEA